MFTHLVTHSGAFHADDLFAAAALRRLAPLATLVRTRDAAHAFALAEEGGVVFDVGMIHDPVRRLFDHHQPDRDLRPAVAGKEAVPYSAFGLVWQVYGHQVVGKVLAIPPTDPRVDEVWGRLDRGFVTWVDMGDNGVVPPEHEGVKHPMSITRVLETFVPPFDAPADDMDRAFLAAMGVAGAILEAKIVQVAAEARASQVARAAIAGRADPRWAELPQGMPYLHAVRQEKADELLYVLMPDRGQDQWSVSAVRKSDGPLGCRKPMPAAWAGLRDADLARASGVPDAVFCHLGRFLAIARSREGALALLMAALDTPLEAMPPADTDGARQA